MAENGKTTWADCLRDPESLASRCGWSREVQRRLLLSFLAVFLFGLAAHAYGFLRAGYSHDMLNALVVEPVETYWKMQLGRPGIVLYRRVLRGLIAAGSSESGLAQPLVFSDHRSVPDSVPPVHGSGCRDADRQSFAHRDDGHLPL